MSSEGTVDKNYLSLNANSNVLYAGTDTPMGIPDADIPTTLVPIDPKEWDAILKCSGRKNTILTGLNVPQGKENSLDINNRCESLHLEGDWGIVGDEGEQVITIKGGSNIITVGGNIHSTGKRADICLGLWSDQSTEKSDAIWLRGLHHVSGRPLTVIKCRVGNHVYLPEGAKVLKLKSALALIGWWAKFFAVKVGIIKT